MSLPNNRLRIALLAGFVASLIVGFVASPLLSQRRGNPAERRRLRQAEALGQPFKGITADGKVQDGLFAIQSTGVSTKPIVDAAQGFLAGLSEEQRKKTLFDVDHLEWRTWTNVHMGKRAGVGFNEMDAKQRELAFGLMKASLSAKGLQLTRDIMRLNHTLAELTDNFDEYGEWLYWITVMGEPSADKPWGWQLDGHHVILNYFVLGDQVVMTPSFFGSEPIIAPSGKYKGVAILQDEQSQGLALIQSLDARQQEMAIVETEKPSNNIRAQAYSDNLVLDYAGIRGDKLSTDQREALLALAGLYVGNFDDGHAKVKMADVRKHLDETYFAWIGGTGDDAIFYYRIHSPVVLIEFDHERPVALGGPRVPSRRHIHAVIRTPNGNDYGKDLLRQHYERSHSSGD